MAYIDLFNDRESLGRVVLPATVRGTARGHTFTLGGAVLRGSNGVVFRSRWQGEGLEGEKTCALKVLRQQSTQRLDRFWNEVRIIKTLEHPSIAPYFDEGTCNPDGTVYQIPWMALKLGGANLREEVERNGPLPPDLLLSVAVQACSAVEHLHNKGIIHRDIKPDNFVWELNHENSIQMIDFGIAKYFHEDVSGRPMDNFTRDGEFVGPVFFSSPELIAYSRAKETKVGPPSDLFQLGKVIWYLATKSISAGVPSKNLCPFGGNLHRLILDLLADSPADRPESASTLISELRRL